LDDYVSVHLPNLKLKDSVALKQITIVMLLNHTSGIDGDVQPNYGHDEETIEKAIARFVNVGQIHAPGAECSYCNGGFVIAGYLVQRLTGRSWYDLIKERIYRPLGMRHAVTLPEEALLYRASVGHHWDAKTKRQVRTSFSLLPLSFAPGGTTLMMSATDLITFVRAHLAGGLGFNNVRILSERSTQAMRQQTAYRGECGSSMGFGLGWQVLNKGVFGHGGGAPGVSSMIYMHPAKDFAVAVLTNSEHGRVLVDDLMWPRFKELIGSPSPYHCVVEVPRQDAKVVDAKRYVGTYENVLSRYEVSELPSGLGISMCFKFSLYDSSKTEMSPPVPLQWVGGNAFSFSPTEFQSGALLGMTNQIRVVFKTPNADGYMQHLSVPDGRPEGRLYRRLIPRPEQ
jgi:CubicO group peptidase (beta-lactamase class C family)